MSQEEHFKVIIQRAAWTQEFSIALFFISEKPRKRSHATAAKYIKKQPLKRKFPQGVEVLGNMPPLAVWGGTGDK